MSKLIHDGTLLGDIEKGIIGNPEDDDSVISNRLNYLTYQINTSYLFKIDNPTDEILQKERILFECLSQITDDKIALLYIRCLIHIFKEWNHCVDGLLRIISDIKNIRIKQSKDGEPVEGCQKNNPEDDQSNIPSSRAKELPKELDTPEIREVLDKAIQIGLLYDYYTLKGSKMLLACFCWGICKQYDLGTIAKSGKDKGGFAADWCLFDFIKDKSGNNIDLKQSWQNAKNKNLEKNEKTNKPKFSPDKLKSFLFWESLCNGLGINE